MPSLSNIDSKLIAGAFSFFSSLVLFAFSNSYNSDSIVYLHTADVFSSSGWQAAKDIYQRPFYSAIIGSFSDLTNLSTITSAQIISAFLVGLTGFSFVHLLSSLGANTQTLKIGAVIICVYPGIASYKDYFIRDFGYWAFLLLTISFCVTHYRTGKLTSFFLWIICGILATLFRPEALALISTLLASSILFAVIEQEAKSTILKQYLTFTVILGGATAAMLLLTAAPLAGLYEFAIYGPEKTLAHISTSWQELSKTLELEILNRHSREFSSPSLVAIYTTIYASQLVNGLSIPLAGGLLYFAYKRQLKYPHSKFIVVAALTTVIVTATFLISKQFIQTRYLVFLCLLLLVPLTFAISNHAAEFSSRSQKAVILLASFLFLDAHISLGHSKKYISDSIRWIQENSEDNLSIISNDPQISYLSGKAYDFTQSNGLRGDEVFNASKISANYDIVAWKSDKGTQLQPSLQINKNIYNQAVFFSNSRDDRVTIYLKHNL